MKETLPDATFNLTLLIALAGMGVTIIIALWKVFQAQILHLEKNVNLAKNVMQDQLDRRFYALERETALIRDQVIRIEQTRPTTGELQAALGNVFNLKKHENDK